MLCELCHKNEAAGTLHRKDANGEDEDLYVCKECLAKHQHGGKDKSGRHAKIVGPDGDEPPEFIRNFLDAAVGLIEGVAQAGPPPVKKCPVCGRTWEQIEDDCAVGCPDCWAQFGAEIRKKFLKGSYGPKHIGKIPMKAPDGKPSRAFLEKELKDAVAKQNYRKAARIRKELDALDDGKKDGNQK